MIINLDLSKSKELDYFQLIKDSINKYYCINNLIYIYVKNILNLKDLESYKNNVFILDKEIIYQGIIFSFGLVLVYKNISISQYTKISVSFFTNKLLMKEISKDKFIEEYNKFLDYNSKVIELTKSLINLDN